MVLMNGVIGLTLNGVSIRSPATDTRQLTPDHGPSRAKRNTLYHHLEASDMQQTVVHHPMSKFEWIRLSLGSEGTEKEEGDSDVALAPEKARVKPPSKYQVLLLNDDFTPMDFVIEVLEKFFNMPTEQATQVMLMVHTQGKAVCGTYSKDIAETKAQQVNEYSREFQHPLLCKILKID